MNFWQMSAGDGTTDVLDVFLKLKVALIGPGIEGDYFDNIQTYDEMNVNGNLVRRFAKEMEIGDIIVLKHIKDPNKKTWSILSIGTVVSPYRYEPIFDRVDDAKWDMQHCRRVEWIVPGYEITVQNGGAPIRLQRLSEDNPLRTKAEEIISNYTGDE